MAKFDMDTFGPDDETIRQTHLLKEYWNDFAASVKGKVAFVQELLV